MYKNTSISSSIYLLIGFVIDINVWRFQPRGGAMASRRHYILTVLEPELPAHLHQCTVSVCAVRYQAKQSDLNWIFR